MRVPARDARSERNALPVVAAAAASAGCTASSSSSERCEPDVVTERRSPALSPIEIGQCRFRSVAAPKIHTATSCRRARLHAPTETPRTRRREHEVRERARDAEIHDEPARRNVELLVRPKRAQRDRETRARRGNRPSTGSTQPSAFATIERAARHARDPSDAQRSVEPNRFRHDRNPRASQLLARPLERVVEPALQAGEDLVDLLRGSR